MQAQFNDLHATSVDVMKRVTRSNGHAWDRFTQQQNKLLGVCAELFDSFSR